MSNLSLSPSLSPSRSNLALDALIDVRREEWDAKEFPRALTLVHSHPYIEVHHSVFPANIPGKEHCRRIQDLHLGFGWNGPFYGIGMDTNGILYELRGIGFRSIGKYNPQYSDGSWVDPQALCLVLFGNFEITTITRLMRDTLDLVRRAAPDHIFRWHQMRDKTLCPGVNTKPVLIDMNDMAPIDTPVEPDLSSPTFIEDKMELLYDTSNWACWVHYGNGTVLPVRAVDFHPWWVGQVGAPKEKAWTGRVLSHPFMTSIVAKMTVAA